MKNETKYTKIQATRKILCRRKKSVDEAHCSQIRNSLIVDHKSALNVHYKYYSNGILGHYRVENIKNHFQ